MTPTPITSRPQTPYQGERGLDAFVPLGHRGSDDIPNRAPCTHHGLGGTGHGACGGTTAPNAVPTNIAAWLCKLHSHAPASQGCANCTALRRRSAAARRNQLEPSPGKGIATRPPADQAAFADEPAASSPHQTPRSTGLCKLHRPSDKNTTWHNSPNTEAGDVSHQDRHTSNKRCRRLQPAHATPEATGMGIVWRPGDLIQNAGLCNLHSTSQPFLNKTRAICTAIDRPPVPAQHEPHDPSLSEGTATHQPADHPAITAASTASPLHQTPRNADMCNLHSRWQSCRRLSKSHNTGTIEQDLCNLHSANRPSAMRRGRSTDVPARQIKLRRRTQKRQGCANCTSSTEKTAGREIHALLSFRVPIIGLCNLHRPASR